LRGIGHFRKIAVSAEDLDETQQPIDAGDKEKDQKPPWNSTGHHETGVDGLVLPIGEAALAAFRAPFCVGKGGAVVAAMLTRTGATHIRAYAVVHLS
jgi:hypothetical protein